ncbi:hypothetical protein IAG44_22085 [Streptomyces roseirectus]|uniref:Uncharacterized protein n=1 Tax=Streptomyces roseirectus TaxID=2768066 RepID=A0A7H0IGC0_9ACTN|nr:ribonuclease domain-containing protein [Streptomyces roseirectus]QNP71836.1 hypothetical protein IAG44_22085 [Streptomyces roseirectus]
MHPTPVETPRTPRTIWRHDRRYLALFLLLATLFTGALQATPALQPTASAAVSGNINGTTNPPNGLGFVNAINYWSGRGWPNLAANRTDDRILCNLQPARGGCVNTRQFIDGGGRYADRDGQLRRYLLGGGSGAPVCAAHGSTPCTGGPNVGTWIGFFHEYDVEWRDTRRGDRGRLRIVRVHGGPNDGDTFVTTDHYSNFTYVGPRF